MRFTFRTLIPSCRESLAQAVAGVTRPGMAFSPTLQRIFTCIRTNYARKTAARCLLCVEIAYAEIVSTTVYRTTVFRTNGAPPARQALPPCRKPRCKIPAPRVRLSVYLSLAKDENRFAGNESRRVRQFCKIDRRTVNALRILLALPPACHRPDLHSKMAAFLCGCSALLV